MKVILAGVAFATLMASPLFLPGRKAPKDHLTQGLIGTMQFSTRFLPRLAWRQRWLKPRSLHAGAL
jgi:hypothetical protein